LLSKWVKIIKTKISDFEKKKLTPITDFDEAFFDDVSSHRRCYYLSTLQTDGDDIALGGLDLTKEITLLLVGNPARLLGVIGFRLIDTPLLQRHEQVGGGILILLIWDWLRHLD